MVYTGENFYKSKKKIYMKVSNDGFELPEAVAGSIKELAKICGITPQTIYTSLYRFRNGELKRTRYVAVDVEE